MKVGLSSFKPMRFKAILVVKEFTQVEGIDYNEICSAMVKYTTVKIVLALLT